MRAKVYRDPVHDIISFKETGQLGELVGQLVDAPELQRLRFVRQLGLAYLVFHGAEHSRFAHSLGVAHLARRMCERLPDAYPSWESRFETIAASLLHDAGHAPFSHAFERVFALHHEAYSVRIILDESTAVNEILRTVDATLPARVARLVAGDGDGPAADIVSSQFDADRCDYLLRDAHMTGVEVGRYDLERILLMLDHDERGIIIDARAFEAVEDYLIARYHMYRLVYFHKTVRAAEAMLENAFARARTLMRAGVDGVVPSGPLGGLMRGDDVPAAEFTELRDFDAWSAVAAWRHVDDPVLPLLADGLLKRELFKANERRGDDASRERDRLLEARFSEELSESERSLFFVDEASDVPYRPYLPSEPSSRSGIRIRERDGRVVRIESMSPVVRTLADASYALRRWHYHPLIAPKLRRIAGDEWQA